MFYSFINILAHSWYISIFFSFFQVHSCVVWSSKTNNLKLASLLISITITRGSWRFTDMICLHRLFSYPVIYFLPLPPVDIHITSFFLYWSHIFSTLHNGFSYQSDHVVTYVSFSINLRHSLSMFLTFPPVCPHIVHLLCSYRLAILVLSAFVMMTCSCAANIPNSVYLFRGQCCIQWQLWGPAIVSTGSIIIIIIVFVFALCNTIYPQSNQRHF